MISLSSITPPWWWWDWNTGRVWHINCLLCLFVGFPSFFSCFTVREKKLFFDCLLYFEVKINTGIKDYDRHYERQMRLRYKISCCM